MIDAKTFRFLRDLGNNNSKAWVDDHRAEWNAARDNFVSVASRFTEHARDYDNRIGTTHLDPKRCFTRLNRDPRLRHGRPPYKSDTYIFVNSGSTVERFGYYLHVLPGRCTAGASLFIPSRDALHRMRDRIADKTDEWLDLVNDADFRKVFPKGVVCLDSLTSMPRGYASDHPAADFLKMKGFGTAADVTHAQLQQDDAITHLTRLFAASRPIADFLN